METSVNNRLALTISAAAALLAGCTGAQAPIGAPATIPQTAASASIAAHSVHRATSGWAYKVLYAFRNSRGKNPAAPLLDINGTLYGTTKYGGTNNNGTVFAIPPNAHGIATLLHDFGASGDGVQPASGLLDVDGTLYGTTVYGGASGAGTVYTITTSGSEKVLYSFTDGTDGGFPSAGLIAVKSTLYGTTAFGGDLSCTGEEPGCGTVYSISASGSEHVLHSFSGGSDGEIAEAGVTAVNGMLYGTTAFAGSAKCGFGEGCGTVYRMSTAGKEKVLYNFVSGTDGANPSADLLDVNGTLYGTTLNGGAGCGGGTGYNHGCGTVYSITTSGTEKVLHRFTSSSESDGIRPFGSLVEMNGTLYGTTYFGGQYCNGGDCG